LLSYGTFAIERGGNYQEKSNLLLYAKYVFYAEIHSDLALIHFLFFLVVSFLSIAKAPYDIFILRP